MNRAAVAADPLPDPKPLSTFWAADHTAIGTGLGCVAFVRLCECHPCVIAFISEEVAQRGPADVRGGLGPPGFDLPLRRNVSDKYRTSLVDYGAGILMQRIFAPVGNLGVERTLDRARPTRCAGASRAPLHPLAEHKRDCGAIG